MTFEELQRIVESNAQAIQGILSDQAQFRQDLLDTHVQLSSAQTSAWDAVAQTNRTVNQVNNSIFQLTQEITRLRAGQEEQTRVLDYLLRQEEERQRRNNP